jgi:outer membrane lipoprotein-sorting protein
MLFGSIPESRNEDASMIRRLVGIHISLALTASWVAAADNVPVPSAAEIVAKNITARGGLENWRTVQTMSLSGKVGAGGNQRATLQMPTPSKKEVQQMVARRPVEEVQLPFLMELKRPRKMRFELQFNGQTAVQVYDGITGWKLRPFLNRRVVEPFSEEETRISSMQSDLDGPLVDYAAKSTQLEFGGVEKVEDRDTYKIKMTMKNGQTLHVWIDAQTFLEAKIEGQPKILDGTPHPVEVYFRDFRTVNGLQIPFVLETKVLPVARTALGFKDPPVPTEKITIERVVVNPNLDDSRFTKPEIQTAANGK